MGVMLLLTGVINEHHDTSVIQRCINVPCFLDIFHAGPSSDRSISIGLSFVALPSVICVNNYVNQHPQRQFTMASEVKHTSLDLMR